MNFLRQLRLLLIKDLRNEFREASHWLSILVFGFLLLILFSFALSIEPDLMRKMAPGLFWLSILFSGILMLDHSFQRETDEASWEGILLLGADPKALYLAKTASILVLMLLLQASLLPLMAVLFDVPLSPALAGVLVLGSLGIAGLGVSYASLTATLKAGQVVLPLLLFPMLIPLVLSSVMATRFILVHDLFGQGVLWIRLLVLFDTVFILGSLLGADILMDRS